MACNNAAICQLYAWNLKGGLQQLEHSLEGHPEEVLCETVLLNLTSLRQSVIICCKHGSQEEAQCLGCKLRYRWC